MCKWSNFVRQIPDERNLYASLQMSGDAALGDLVPVHAFGAG